MCISIYQLCHFRYPSASDLNSHCANRTMILLAPLVSYHLVARIKKRACLRHVSEDVNSMSKFSPPSVGKKLCFLDPIKKKKNRQKRYRRLDIQLKMRLEQ